MTIINFFLPGGPLFARISRAASRARLLHDLSDAFAGVRDHAAADKQVQGPLGRRNHLLRHPRRATGPRNGGHHEARRGKEVSLCMYTYIFTSHFTF